MKKYILLIVPLLLSVIVLSGCGKADMQGEWKIDEVVYTGDNADAYNFYKDGTFDYGNDGLALDEGKYEVKGDTVKLKGKHNDYTIKVKDGKQFKYDGKVYKKSN